MQLWLPETIVINGGDSATPIGGLNWERIDGEIYFTSFEIDRAIPGETTTYKLEQINVEYDGRVSDTRTLLNGNYSPDFASLGFAFFFADNTYKAISTNVTENGLELRVADANSIDGQFGSFTTIISDSLFSDPSISFRIITSYSDYYTVGWSVAVDDDTRQLFFQSFDPVTNAPLSPAPISDGTVSSDTYVSVNRWNDNRIVVSSVFEDTLEGNTDIQLRTRVVDGVADQFDRDYIIDVDLPDIDWLTTRFAGGQIGNADGLYIAIDDNIAAPTPTSQVHFIYFEDMGSSARVVAQFTFGIANVRADIRFSSIYNPATDNVVYFMAFLEDGDIKAVTFDVANESFSERLTVAENVSLSNFGGITNYADGRFLVHWRQGNEQGGFDQVAQIVDTRGTTPILDQGSANDDRIAGSAFDDVLAGQNGNDMIAAGLGADKVSGGAGDDTLNGGAGNDTISGGADNNHMLGGAGLDKLWGGTGDDTIEGGTDNDTISGFQGDNQLHGQDGDDKVWGGNFTAFTETLTGGMGDDTLGGGRGDDRMEGGDDNDLIFGGDGTDTAFGGTGQDTIFGNNNADELHGGANADLLLGNAGQDTLFGDGGADTLEGGTGADLLRGGDDNDLLVGAAGFDVLDGGAGNDTLRGGSKNDTLEGGNGNDALNDFVGVDTWVFRDNDGNDTVNGFGADDRIVMLGGASEAQTHAEFIAASTDVGGNLVYDFGGDGLNVITITNYSVASFGFSQFDDML
ncbi:calcium-binding protein [Roseobacteraceae bacterium S113]